MKKNHGFLTVTGRPGENTLCFHFAPASTKRSKGRSGNTSFHNFSEAFPKKTPKSTTTSITSKLCHSAIARHALRDSTRTHSGAPSVQTARQVSSRDDAVDREGAWAQARVACGTATRVQSKAERGRPCLMTMLSQMLTWAGRHLLRRGRGYLLPCLSCPHVHARDWKRQLDRLWVQRRGLLSTRA